jgi:CheY-like chemotaxis protein
VENPKDLNVLVYERRAVYAESVCWSLENMGVPYTMVTAIDDFAKTLKKEQWSYIISGYGLYDKIKKVMNMPKEEYPGEKIPPLALLVEWDSEAFVPNVRLTSLPIQTLSIANILTGKTDVKVYSDTSGGVIRYSFPNARMLVVDDIYTNLKVAEGLLAPYHCIVDTCLSGQEAIEMVKHFKYDIIFMDHMMPDMDGIETTVMIREWEKEILLADEEHLKENKKQLPIIALTANAVSGVREMLIKKGFSDFIAKPIDLSKLDEVINRWVSKEKRNNSKIKSSHSAGSEKIDHHSIKIDGIEIYKGMKMTGGTKDRFFSVLSLFCKDAQKRLDILRQPIKEETDVKTFEINIHAIKSAAAAIGAEELFSEAFRLENACRVGDKEYILNNRDLFADQLSKLIEGINFALGSEKEENVKTSVQDFDNLDSKMQVISLLIELEKALISQKAEDIDNLLTEINKQQMDDKTKEAMEVITDDVLMTEFGKAIKTVNECMTNLI